MDSMTHTVLAIGVVWISFVFGMAHGRRKAAEDYANRLGDTVAFLHIQFQQILNKLNVNLDDLNIHSDLDQEFGEEVD